MSEPRRSCWSILLVLALVLVTGACHAAVLGGGIQLRADPDRVPADGASSVVISVEVVDALGMPARDGTMVYIVATLGEVVSPVQTIGGLAQTVLTAPNAAGTALVSAVAGTARQTIQVEFLPEPGSASPASQIVELTADELAYSADRQVLVATWQAELRYQAVEIQADSIQYDVSPSVVRAQGNVSLRSGKRTIQADALRYELVSLRGRLVRLSEEPERLLVEGDRLETRLDESPESALWEPLYTGETRTWVKARQAVVDPGRKIILDHATFYVDETRVMSLRRHVVDPASGSAVFGNALGFSSGSGISLDLPMYYRASANHLGSVHITRNRALGGSQWEPGWSLGVREEYMRSGGAAGAVELDDLFHPDRGVRWEHRHRFGGNVTMSLDASSLSFDEIGPRLRSGSLSLSRPTASGGRLSLLMSRSDLGRSEQSLSDLQYRFPGFRSVGGVIVTPAAHVRHSALWSDIETLVFDPETGEPLQIAQQQTGRTTSPGAELNFSLPMKPLGRHTKLNLGATAGYAWGLAGGAQALLDGRALLDRRFGPNTIASLGFSYSSRAAGLQQSFFSSGRQLLTLSGQTIVKGASVRASASQDMAGERRFGSLHVSRGLPFGSDAIGRPLWDLELSHVFSRLNVYSARSTRLSLGRALGSYRASLCYSPQGVGDQGSRPWLSPLGYGYTYSGGRHLWLEITARPY